MRLMRTNLGHENEVGGGPFEFENEPDSVMARTALNRYPEFVVESVLDEDLLCRFAIHIPPDIMKSYVHN
jgi:hypothetical protein